MFYLWLCSYCKGFGIGYGYNYCKIIMFFIYECNCDLNNFIKSVADESVTLILVFLKGICQVLIEIQLIEVDWD